MNNAKCQSLFFISLPELQKLCVVKVTVSSQLAATEIRMTQRKMCRQLLLLHEDVLSSPVPGTLNQISVVMTISFYKSGKIQAYIEKHGAMMARPERVIPAVFQTCFSYTLITKLAPMWNQAGHLLIQGKDFLSLLGKQNAVVMEINVSETHLCISLEVCMVRLPPAELEDFNISRSIIKQFDTNKNAVIQRHSILNNWCYVLPSMKMGRIITISHIIPCDSTFRSCSDLQLYWENLYGYILPEDIQTYCNVYFKFIGEQLFTYPLSCIRSQPVQYFPRVDIEGVLNAFLTDLKTILPYTCGVPLKMTSKALYATQDLTQSSAQKINSKPANLTGKRSCKVTSTHVIPKAGMSSPSMCTTKDSHKMELNLPKIGIFSNLSLLAKDGSTTIVEKKAHNREQWKTSEESAFTLHSTDFLKVSKNLPVDFLKRDSTKIIPIFKGKLLQVDRQTTKANHGKKKQNVSQYSAKIVETNAAANLAVSKVNVDQVNKSLYDSSLKHITSRTLQIKTGRKNVKHAKLALKEKNEYGQCLANCAISNETVLDRNSSEIKSRRRNASLLPDTSVHLASTIHQHLTKPENHSSSNKAIRKAENQSTGNTGSKRTYLCISHSDVEVEYPRVHQNQTSPPAETKMNAYRLNSSVHKLAPKGGDQKESQGRSNDCIIKRASHHEQFNHQQTNESFHCEDVNLRHISSKMKTHRTSIPNRSGKRHQIKEERGSYSESKKPRTNKLPV
ncbi:uncharacterized protein C18orf63 homolog isoform X2 [Hemicordylus capensis]|uniref:uncharacterized protein C18orf63 homolog isoform X2 n=1 Tax=Hemicordylus capensis TaxID=884348 RepID=UPI0023045037|nr:uncharacterized protein C18orf63 homolog isoform X2 [Hemicordylus capensis]